MRARPPALVAAALLAACSSNAPSRLDGIVASTPLSSSGAADPWAGSGLSSMGRGPTTGGDAADADDDFDLKGMLSKLSDSLDKPGPYEAPEASTGFAADKPHWGVLGLSGAIVEREAYSWSGGSGTELRQVVARLRSLAKDAHLQGLLVQLAGVEISVPDVIELRAAMHELRTAGKTLACHTEDASNAAYLVLAACEQIGIAPLGQIAVTGPAAMPIHVKPLLDRLGVTADFLHVGTYKGAAEPLTREAPSAEMQETLGAILDRRYQTMVDVIAAERKLAPDGVKGLIDTGLFPSQHALTAKLVDAVTSFEAFRDKLVGAGAWTELELEPDGKDQLQAMLKLARFVGAMPPERPVGPHVAVVYALGDIVDGGGDGVLGARQQIAAHTLVAALRTLTADDSVKAVVLRIDSGGGSAQASELIWEAVDALTKVKPVVVSMSDVAASGGYYIASGATKIFALDDTLTGSIGVVGGKIAPGGALARLGINTFPIGRGKRATMMASLGPWSEEDKAVIQRSMEEVYDVFTGRVAQGRGAKVKDVKAIAQGRVWTGTQAKELGLVDELGGLDAALTEARTLAKVDADAALEIYPPSPTLRDVLSSVGAVHAPLGLSLDATAMAALGALDPVIAQEASRLIALALSFRTTAIQAITVLPLVR